MSERHWELLRGVDGMRVSVPLRGESAVPRQVRQREIKVGGKRYLAYDAHQLLDATSEMGRPGMPY